MALTITDVEKTAADVGIDGVTINSGAETTGSELDRGENAAVETVTGLLTVTFAAAPDDGGYMTVRLEPLDGTGGTLFDDGIGAAIVPVEAAQQYQADVQLAWPAGARYVKSVVGNEASENTDADSVSLELRWQAVTV
jgi:hypothetical protein